MKAYIKNEILNDGFVELFKFDDIQPRLNEDLLKGVTGALAGILGVGLVKAVAAHNIMELKKYMKKVTKLVTEGHGKNWDEPSYKSIVNDEKRNALMITFQMAKFAGIYDFVGKDSMPNSNIEMPKVAGGSTSNFKSLLKKKTKWFGLKTVSDPLKNLNSIKPAKDENPNAYFTDILEQYRNALKRVFGETEAKQITDTINSLSTNANNAAAEFEKLTNIDYRNKDAVDKFLNSLKDLSKREEYSNLLVQARKEEGVKSSGDLYENLITVFNQVIGSHDQADYIIFKDMNKAMDDLVATYDNNIKEAITNNRSILDKKLKRDGLLSLWSKYVNLLRTSKQQYMDEFNKSVEYTYLKDFLRGTMLSFFSQLMPKVNPAIEDNNDDIVKPEEEEEEDIDINAGLSYEVSYDYVGAPQEAETSESYIFQHVINKLNEADSDEEDILKLKIISLEDKPLGSIVTFMSSSDEEGYENELANMKEEISSNFSGSSKAQSLDDIIDMIPFVYYLNEGAENTDEWSRDLNLNSKELHNDVGYDSESSPYIISLSYQLDEDGNLSVDTKPFEASWINQSTPQEDDITPEEEEEEITPEDEEITESTNSLIAKELSKNPRYEYEIKNKEDKSPKVEPEDSMVCFIFTKEHELTDEEGNEALDAAQYKWVKKDYGYYYGFECQEDYKFVIDKSDIDSIGAEGTKIFFIGLTKDDQILESNVLDFSIEASGDDDDFEIEVMVNDTPIDRTPKDVEEDEDILESSLIINEEASSIQSSDSYNITFYSKAENCKSALVVFSNSPISSFQDIVKKYNEKSIFARTFDCVDSDKEEFKKKGSWTVKKDLVKDFKYVYIIPRTALAKEVLSEQNTLFDKAKVGTIIESEPAEETNTNLPSIIPKGELVSSGEFRIGLDAKNIKMCVVLISTQAEFINNIKDANNQAFKNNIDKIPYNRKDAFKIISQADNHSVIFLNFGEDSTAIRGIKFKKDFITFENPGDTIYFKIYPVTVEDGHLVLHPELASGIGEYTYNPNEGNDSQNNQIGSNAILPGKSQKQIAGNNQKQIESKNGNI